MSDQNLSVDETRSKRAQKYKENEKDNDGDVVMKDSNEGSSSSSPTVKKKKKRDSLDKTSSKGKKSSFDKYVHRTICKIFKVTLYGSTSDDYYLDQLASYIEETNSGQTSYIQSNMIEAVLVERLSNGISSQSSPLQYLITCYNNANSEYNLVHSRGKPENEEKLNFLNEMRNMICSYIGILLSDIEMFPHTEEQRKDVQKVFANLLKDNGNSQYINDSLLNSIVSSLDDEELKQIFEPIFTEMSNQMAKCTIVHPDCIPLLNLLNRITRSKQLAILFVNHKLFLPNSQIGSIVETSTLLGPFFSLTALYDQPSVAQQYFPNPKSLSKQAADSSKYSIRNSLQIVYNSLQKVLLNFLKPKETRGKILDWLGSALEGNKSKMKMREDFLSCSTDGFLFTLSSVLLKLCEPFVKGGKKKAEAIKPDYTMLNERIDFKDDTKLGVSKDEAKTYYEKKMNEKNLKKTFPFPIECFFMTYRALKIGPLKTIEKYQKKIREYNKLKRQSRQYAAAHGLSDPNVQKLDKSIEKLAMGILVVETQINDQNLQIPMLEFYKFASHFVVIQADPERKGIPLPEKAEIEYASLPEFFIEDILDFLLYISRFDRGSLEVTGIESIFDLFAYFVGNEQYITNPYIRSKIPELLSTFTPDDNDNDMSSTMRGKLFDHKLMKTYLMQGLMKLYVDLERTGSSNQFYDKFTPRYYISVVIRYLWKYDEYKASFAEEMKVKDEKKIFLKFFNMLLNDAIYLLDESLKELQEIKIYQDLINNPTEWNKLTNEEQQERTSQNENREGYVTSYLMLAKETVHMLNYLSKDVPEPFLRPEMISRTASMLNYFLVELAGPKCQNLKVKGANKYHFDPKYLISEIFDSYVNLCQFNQFKEAVASDQRSFYPDVFKKGVAIMRKINTRLESSIKIFEKFVNEVIEVSKSLNEEDIDTDDVPDEYLDPITYEIMKNPVFLPTSNMYIDRSTIERHLLNDPIDPFNRKPLKTSDLQPASELKQKIIEFVKKYKLNKSKSN